MTEQIIRNYVIRHERILQQLLNESEIAAPQLKKAIFYSLFSGGKRLRPLFVYLFGELLNVEPPSLDIIAAAIELTHCYSLVHDDLPAMDDDDMRRGKPSCHRAFDEATAILVGDGLQAYAIEVLLKYLPHYLTSQQVVAITLELVQASGLSGMVSGQALDLSELKQESLNELRLNTIHRLKTGKLFEACANMVFSAATRLEKGSQQALRNFTDALGLAFQIQDDYLDRYSDTDLLGKGRASDTANQKLTYATLLTQKELKTKIEMHYRHAKDALVFFGDRAEKLLLLINQLEERSGEP